MVMFSQASGRVPWIEWKDVTPELLKVLDQRARNLFPASGANV